MTAWTLDERGGDVRIGISARKLGWEDIETVLFSLRSHSGGDDVRKIVLDLRNVDALAVGAVGTLAAWRWLAEARGQHLELIAEREIAEQLRRCGLWPPSSVPEPDQVEGPPGPAVLPADAYPARA